MQAVYRPDENAADIFFDVSFQNAEVMAHGLPQLSIKQNNVNDFRSHVYEFYLKHSDQHDPPCAAIFCLYETKDEIIQCTVIG